MQGGRSGCRVGKPRHRHLTNPRTRCNPMTTPPSGAWSVFQQILAEHWEAFQRAHPRYHTPSDAGLVAKMLGCGDPDTMGSSASRCLQCGEGTPRVAMRGQASWCVRCATVHVDHWGRQVSTMRHEGVI
jgi:hypothetical protein